MEGKNTDKEGVLYPLYNLKNMIVLPSKPERSLSHTRMKVSWYHVSKTLITLTSIFKQKEYIHILKTYIKRENY